MKWLFARFKKAPPPVQAPLSMAGGLREGMPVKLANSDVTGKLIAVGRAVDSASQTVLLRAAVSKGAETLTPGQAVEVELPAAGTAGQRLPAVEDAADVPVAFDNADSRLLPASSVKPSNSRTRRDL